MVLSKGPHHHFKYPAHGEGPVIMLALLLGKFPLLVGEQDRASFLVVGVFWVEVGCLCVCL